MEAYRIVIGIIVFLLVTNFQVNELQAEPVKTVTVEQAYPGFATGVLKSARLIKMEKGILAKTEGIEIRESVLQEHIKGADSKTRRQLEKNLFYILEQEMMKRILLKEARSYGIVKKHISDLDTIRTYLSQIADRAEVSEADARSFYNDNKKMVGGMPFEQAREIILQFLVQQKRQDLIDSHIRDLGKKADIEVNMDWVKRQQVFARSNPVDRARMSGRPTMVEFGATGCIPCDMMQPILDKLRKNFSGRLNVVFVHVRENPVLGSRFGIRSIPMQVFFDKDGKEVFRHMGFYEEKEVMKQLAKMGIE
jgi:thiol-disulfide isomerase/thioredoxin